MQSSIIPVEVIKNLFRCSLWSLMFLATAICVRAQSTTPVGTTAVVGKVDNVAVEVKVQGPSAQATPLQVACLFEYTEGDIFNPPALAKELNGMVHLDEAFKGLITELRKSGKFAGHQLETLLITPPPGTIPAKKLLLIGLGNRDSFTSEVMYRVAQVEMREALRLGVSAYSHASDLKDAGVSSVTDEVAGNLVRGAIDAYRTQQYLKTKKASDARPLVKFTLLSGPSFFTDTREGVKKVVDSLQQPS